jgi:probable phosphoglycerate mutase
MTEARFLWLVRHGETEWSKSGQHTGRTDLPLTDVGRAQARDIVPKLANVALDWVLVSPRLRARETCDIAGYGPRAVIEPDLAEWDYGRYEGLTSPQIRAANPTWSLWRDGAPDGESVSDVMGRVERLLARVASLEPNRNVALFAHGHILRSVAIGALGWPPSFGEQLELGTAAVSQLVYRDRDVHVVRWNT